MAGKMAAAELKHDNVSCNETAKRHVSTVISHREIECYRFRPLDLIYYLISVSFFFVDIATDSIVFTEYLMRGQFTWGGFALSFTIVPATMTQLFSLRWYHSDGSLRNIHWLLHFLFLGVLHRYLTLLCAAIHSFRSKRFLKDKTWVYRQESDVCMLRLFESFMGAAPQLILQLYIMAVLRRAPLWTSTSAIVSFCSLTWAIGTYTKAMHKIHPGHNEATWIALTLQTFWRAGMLISRIAVLVLMAVCIREWFILFLGLHWLFMSIWVILQNTDFCPTIWEECIYNCIIGLIYCFDFFNLRVGKSRYRVLIFYSIIVTQNFIFLVVYVSYFKDTIKTEETAIVASIIVGGMIVGLASMLLYYGKFHPSKLETTSKGSEHKSENVIDNTASPRSFKHYPNTFGSLPRSIDNSPGTASEEVTTDKQFLLTNIVQISESPEDGIVNQSCKIENELGTVESSSNFSNDEINVINENLLNAQCKNVSSMSDDFSDADKDIHRQKRRGICLLTEQRLDIDQVLKPNSSSSCLPSQKRRGICSSTELIPEIESNVEEQATPDSELKSDIVASSDKLEDCSLADGHDIDCIKVRDKLKTPTTFHDSCEKISETENLSKELLQRDETMSCVTSIHDYENVCPLGVARPPWCIRSWKGYTDIETYIHDDSVVRDRRRDTLTSTTTGTTYSSDFSDVTCTSSVLRGILKQDDYLDTLTYDLIDPRGLRSIYTDRENLPGKMISNADEQNATLYIAKPVVIDDKGGMFSLHTIHEERDELPLEKFEYPRSTCDSVSTLVSTIDQIRRYTAENSPRHVYHKTETQWEDLEPKNVIKRAQLTRALFNDLKDPVACNRNYINCLDDAESIVKGKCEIDMIRDLVKYCAIESIKKTPLIDAILSDSPILGNKAKIQKQVSIGYCKDDSSSNDTDLYVEMSPLVSGENIKIVHNNLSELASRSIRNSDTVADMSVSTLANVNVERNESIYDKRKKAINYPKRKFSLLKEKFEPKSQLVYVVTPNNVSKRTELSAKDNKENLAPSSVCKVSQSKNVEKSFISREKVDAVYDNDNLLLCNADLNVKGRQIF